MTHSRHPALAFALALCVIFFASAAYGGQASPTSELLQITKIDPPNRWAGMPKPMWLVRRERIKSAHFTLSHKTLRLDRTEISDSEHWATLWLSASFSQRYKVLCRHAPRLGRSVDYPWPSQVFIPEMNWQCAAAMIPTPASTFPAASSDINASSLPTPAAPQKSVRCMTGWHS